MALNRALRWICVAGLFALAFVPLFVSNHLFFPFISGKGFYFRIITEIILAAWVVLAITDVSVRPKKSWLGWAAVAFVGIIFLADVFGEYPYKSFWSNYERMEGWVTLAHLLGYGIVAATVLGRDMWERLWQTWIGVGMTLILYSFLQIANLLRIDQGANRVDATLGNSAYLAIYMLFVVFLILFFLVRRGKEFNARSHWWLALGFNAGFLVFCALHLYGNAISADTVSPAIFWAIAGLVIGDLLMLFSALFERGRWLYGLLAVLSFFVIFQTETRGTLLGLVGGIALAALLLGLFEKERVWLKRTGWGIVIGLCVVVALFMGLRHSSLVRSNSTLSRLADISISDPTTQSRFLLWDMSWQGFLERPILGWGQESFNYVFNKFYDPRLYSDEQWFDRAHDIVFDWLTAGGALGLLSYFALFGAILWYVWVGEGTGRKEGAVNRGGWEAWKQFGGVAGGNPFSIAERAMLTGLLAGYLVHNLFVFDNITSYLFYVTLAAYVYARRTMWPAEGVGATHVHVRPNRFVLPAVAVVLVLVVYYINVKPLAANIDLINAISPATQPTVSDTITAYQAALAWRSFGDSEVREQVFGSLDQLAGQVSNSAQQTGTGQPDPALVAEESKMITFVKEQAQVQLTRTPNDTRYYLLPASVLADAGDYASALLLLQQAVVLSPKKQTVLFELASVYIGEQKFDQALATLQTAFQLDTSDQMAHLLYAAAAIYDKKEPLANQILQTPPAVSAADAAGSDAVLHAYYFIGDYKAVLNVWQARVAAAPDNINNYVSLAGAYLLLKDSRDAIATLQKVEQLQPQYKTQVDQYITAIQQGKTP